MKTDKNYFALEITVESQSAEAIEFALNELDSLGTEINNLGKTKAETLCVIGYFEEMLTGENVQNQLREALRIYGFSGKAIQRVEWREIENTDWLAEWKKHWKPTKVGRFVIAPTWSEIETGVSESLNREIVIRIDPEMAFGTGTHETTRLCLEAVQEIDVSRNSFFDVGTGTGILAIAAAKLTAAESELPISNFQRQTAIMISACDTDEKSIEIARANARINDVADKIEFFVGSINEKTRVFDYVCANLTADVIVPLLPTLLEKTRFELILSGILREQQNLVETHLRKLRVSDWEVRTDGEWISIKAKRNT